MNSFAATAATVRPGPDAFRAAALAVAVAALLTLAACAAPRTRAPPPMPPAKPTRSARAAPVPAPAPKPQPKPLPTPSLPEPAVNRFEQDKSSARQALAQDNRSALAGSEVGYYMDVLQGRLKQVADKTVGVGRRRDLIVLLVPDGFAPGSAQLSAGARASVTRLIAVLAEYRKTTVSVRVSGGDAGAKSDSPLLADQRGLAVADYLANAGVAEKRIVVAAGHPAAAKSGADKRLRIELQLEPIVMPAASDKAERK